MINVLAGCVIDGPYKGRYIFRIQPNWSAEYLRDEIALCSGWFLDNDEDLDGYKKTAWVIEVTGRGKCEIVQTWDKIERKQYRFYQQGEVMEAPKQQQPTASLEQVAEVMYSQIADIQGGLKALLGVVRQTLQENAALKTEIETLKKSKEGSHG